MKKKRKVVGQEMAERGAAAMLVSFRGRGGAFRDKRKESRSQERIRLKKEEFF